MFHVCFNINRNDNNEFYCELIFAGRIITSKILRQVEAFCGEEYYVNDVWYRCD